MRPGYLAINGTVSIDSPASGGDLARLKREVPATARCSIRYETRRRFELTINHVQQSSAAAE